MNLSRINLFPFGVIETNDTKATYYFIGIVNINTCGNPSVVMNLRHHGTNISCWSCHVGEVHREQRENAQARESHFSAFLKGKE